MDTLIDTRLRPETTQTIRDFGSRRLNLLLLRGLFTFIAVVLPLLVIIALIDRGLEITDVLRWGLSVVAYVMGFFVAWQRSLRHIFGHAGQREMARLLGGRDEKLGEDILSAVELDKPADDVHAGSPALRSLLQDRVGLAVADADIRALLPKRRVFTWFFLSALATIGVVVMSFLLPLFPGFFARAALPFANLGRPSDTIIELVLPDPGNRIVPFHETVEIAAKIDGRIPEKVIIETDEVGGKRRRLDLRRGEDLTFTGEIAIKEADVRYRVFAGGAISPYYSLDAQPRPRIETFGKTYDYPEYSGWPTRSVDEEHGELSALKGATAALKLMPDQKISEGKLLLLDVEGKEMGEKALEVNSDGSLSVEVPMDGLAAHYQLSLTGQASGFASKDDKAYSIESVIDELPIVELLDPLKGREVAPDEILSLHVRVSDDVRLAKVERHHQISGEDWVITDFPVGDQFEEFTHQGEWDLSPLGLGQGDVVLFKMVAVDAFGQKGESVSLRFLVIDLTSGLAAKKAWVEEQAEVARALQNFSETSKELNEALEKAKHGMTKPEEERTLAEQQRAMKAETQLADAVEQADLAFEEVLEKLAETPGKTEQAELMAAGKELADIKSELLEPLAEEMGDLLEKPNDTAHLARQLQSKTGALAKQIADLAAADAAEVAREDLARTAEQQRELADETRQRDEGLAEQLVEKERAVMERIAENTVALEKIEEFASDGEAKSARDTAKRLADQVEKTTAVVEEEEPEKLAEALAQTAEEMKRQTDDALRNVERIEEKLARDAMKAREHLIKEGERVAGESLRIADNEAQQLAREAKNAGEQAASNGKVQEEQAQATEALEQAAEQAQDMAALADAAGDQQEAVDQSRLARALEKLAKESAAEITPENAQALAGAVRSLQEAAGAIAAENRVEDISESLAEAAAEEAGAASENRTSEVASEDLQNVQEQMEMLATDLQRDPELHQQTRDAAMELERSHENRQLEQELKNRERQASQQPAQRNAETAENLQKIEVQVAALDVSLEAKAVEAREVLESMVPSIEEAVSGLAEESAANAEQSELAAKSAEEAVDAAQAADAPDEGVLAEMERAVEATQAVAEELLAEQLEADEALENLQEALRFEANHAELALAEEMQGAREADTVREALQQAAESGEPAAELAEAAETPEAEIQAEALEDAAEQQAERAEGLEKLAAALAKAAAERAAMLAAAMAPEIPVGAMSELEEDLGIKEALDDAFAQAEDVSDLAEQAEEGASSEELMAALEEELGQNPEMQEALGEISENSAADAASDIERAAALEAALGEKVAKQAKSAAEAGSPDTPAPQGEAHQAAAQQNEISQSVAEAAEEMKQAARHEDRLGNDSGAEEMAAAAGELGEMTEEGGELMDAGEALANNKSAAASSAEVGEAVEALGEQAAQAIAAAAATAAETEGSEGGDSPSGQDAPSSTPAEALAEALDALDEQMFGESQSSADSPEKSMDPRDALAAAAEAQAAAMAAARAEGRVPGQLEPAGEPSESQMASEPEEPNDITGKGAAEAPDGGAFEQDDPGINGEVELAGMKNGDWGRLPPDMAKDLIEARGKEVAPEYRAAIESYYRALAQRAKGKKK